MTSSGVPQGDEKGLEQEGMWEDAPSADATSPVSSRAGGAGTGIAQRLTSIERVPGPGGLLYAEYGRGVYIYTGYSFFRELPAGVPGA